MEQLPGIQRFLLETMGGILILGASGSILGALIIYLIKKLVSFARSHSDIFFFVPFYKYFRQARIAEKLSEHQKPSKDTEYLIYCIGEWLKYVLFSFMLILAIGMTAIILLFFGTERPYTLSASISTILLLLHRWLKKGFFVNFLFGRHFKKKVQAIESEQPKTFKKWLKSH